MLRSNQDFVAHSLDRARARLTALSGMRGVIAGLSVGMVLQLMGWPSRGLSIGSVSALIGFAVVGSLAGIWSTSPRRRSIAQSIESLAPECQNLLITAEELLGGSTSRPGAAHVTASPYLTELIFHEAKALLGRLDIASLFPARSTQLAASATLVLAVLSLLQKEIPAIAGAATLPSNEISDILITSIPPSYLKQSSTTQHNPDRVRALAGSKLLVVARSGAAAVTLESLSGKIEMSRDSAGYFSTTVRADADGFLAVEGRTTDSLPGPRHLIGLSVVPDHPPQVQITKPGEDLNLLDGNKTINLVVVASDDIGLASLRVRYVHVSGSGERYTFEEGEVPVKIERTDPTHWRATAAWRLNPLELEPGDVVVYRALATDLRPGAPPTESDAYLAEVLTPGSLAGGGFDTDPEVERYALSQQMIILKTERLLANQKSMTADSFANLSAEIALEQRSVRATFVFMMGGEIAAAPVDMTTLDEEAEAAGEGDMLVGHAKNQGRDALTKATRAMSRAAAWLTEGKATEALPLEREALSQLELAFSHSRILLRALSVQERLDLSRRLTGTLVDAAPQRLPLFSVKGDPRIAAARSALASLAAMSGRALSDSSHRMVSRLAESVLRIDPSSPSLQVVAARLSDATTAAAKVDQEKWRNVLDQATVLLAAYVNASLIPVTPERRSADADRLQGALIDALRRGGSRE